MQKQIEQCVQQMCLGLALGTLVHAREQTEQFCKSKSTLFLTPTKCIDDDPFAESDNWNDDLSSLDTITPTPGENLQKDSDITSPKLASNRSRVAEGRVGKQGFQ